MAAKQTSLIDLLERIPQGARLVVEHDQFSSSSHPVGRLCHEAAAALRAALAQQEEPDHETRAELAEQQVVQLAEERDHYRDLWQKAQQADPETCTWYQDGDSDSGVYATSCGHYFSITDGTPEDNEMSHCCYCGKTLVQELITEDGDE